MESLTEDDWLAYLKDVLASATEPAARRFAAACCRRVLHLTDDPRHRVAVEAAERLASGHATSAEFELALAPVVALWADLNIPYQRWQPQQHLTGATRHLGGQGAAPWAAVFAARAVACRSGDEYGCETWAAAWLGEVAAQLRLVAALQRHVEAADVLPSSDS